MATYNTAVVLEADPVSIARAKEELRAMPGAFAKAVPAAVNKTLDRAKTMTVRQLAEILAVKSQQVIRYTPGGTERIRVVPYGQETADGGTLRIMKRPIGAMNFQTRKVAGGVSLQIFRDEGARTIQGAFFGTGLSNNKHVFTRVPGRGKYRQKAAHYGPNIGRLRQHVSAEKPISLFTVYRMRPQLGQATVAFMSSEFPKQMESQVDRFLKRSKTERVDA